MWGTKYEFDSNEDRDNGDKDDEGNEGDDGDEGESSDEGGCNERKDPNPEKFIKRKRSNPDRRIGRREVYYNRIMMTMDDAQYLVMSRPRGPDEIFFRVFDKIRRLAYAHIGNKAYEIVPLIMPFLVYHGEGSAGYKSYSFGRHCKVRTAGPTQYKLHRASSSHSKLHTIGAGTLRISCLNMALGILPATTLKATPMMGNRNLGRYLFV